MRLHNEEMDSRRPRVGIWLAIVTAVGIVVITLTPSSEPRVLNPFCIACGDFASVDALLNVFLFVPLGAILGISRMPRLRAIVGMTIMSLVIELLQFGLIPGRDPTVRDILMNSLGGIFGFFLGRHRENVLAPDVPLAPMLLIGWTVVWLASQAAAAYAIVPTLPRSRYFGQIARDLGSLLPPFSGRVLRATVGGVAIPDREFPGAAVRELLQRPDGAGIEVSVFPEGCVSGLAGIVRVADEAGREIFLVAQRRTDLVFSIRTGAQQLALRPLRYRLRGVFGEGASCSQVSDTIQLQIKYTHTSILLSAAYEADRQVIRSTHLVPSASQAWHVIVPTATFIDGDIREAILDRIWVALLFLPSGYWAAFVRRGMVNSVSDRSFSFVIGSLMLAVLVIGLVAIPASFGTSIPGGYDWMSALCGGGAGWLLSKVTVRQSRCKATATRR